MTQQPTADRYNQLRERVLNRTATASELREFESIVSQSVDYRRDYLAHLHQRQFYYRARRRRKNDTAGSVSRVGEQDHFQEQD